jgi:hypothetical protein
MHGAGITDFSTAVLFENLSERIHDASGQDWNGENGARSLDCSMQGNRTLKTNPRPILSHGGQVNAADQI